MEVSDQIIKVMNDLSKKLGMTIDWSQQNVIPQLQDFIHRYAKYEMYTSIAWIILGVLVIVATVILVKKSIKYEQSENWSEGVSVFLFVISVIMCICSIASFISICCQIDDIIKVCTIPEAYFIDYVKGLLK